MKKKWEMGIWVMGIGIHSIFAQDADTQLRIEARKDICILASRGYAGRGYVEDGHIKAAHYIARRFEEIGLQQVQSFKDGEGKAIPYFQPFSFPLNVIQDAKISIDGKEQILGKDYIVSDNSPTSKGIAYIEDAGYGLTSEGVIGGEALLFQEGFPPEIKDNPLLKEKFKALTSIDSRKEKLAERKPKIWMAQKAKLTHGFSDTQSDIPGIDFIQDSFPEYPREVRWNIVAEMKDIHSQNVIGMVKGRVFPDSFLIISAHYDHLGKIGDAVFCGANDNASGIAMLLSMAEYFRHNPSKYSIVFIGFGAEETGLIGSQFYVTQNPAVPLKKTKFVLNLDLMGGGDEGIMALAGQDFPDIYQKLSTLNDQMKAVPIVKSRKNAPNSDHYFFILNGVKAFFVYTMGGPPWYHDVFDKPENIELQRYPQVRNLLIRFLENF